MRETLLLEDDIITVKEDEEDYGEGMDISYDELLLRAEIFSNFLKDSVADLFENEEPNF